MGLFILTVLATGQKALVRARCLRCAREQAAREADEEGPMVWRDPALSTAEVFHNSTQAGVILKTRPN